ncbi:MAG TPA: prolyl oligopeptidase family serine peptidase, partial [Hyphomicrobiaceae bacterium]|nr:prolyl oligopeptidase family serine peptidase [Hyphomicrobiaceae bacterium]
MRYARTICPGRGTIAAAVLVFVAALVAGYPSARADDWEIETKDGIRSAIVMPAPQASAPTLVVLHGATISADLTARWSGFAEAAVAHGFAAVFPEGIYKLWNDARGDKLSSSDDVGFLRRLNKELVTRGVADASRIYIAGISNGGMMTLRMLCEAPELYAGAATVIANMPAEAGASCHLTKPMPVIMFNGTADPLVPYRGGGVGLTGSRGEVWAAERTA